MEKRKIRREIELICMIMERNEKLYTEKEHLEKQSSCGGYISSVYTYYILYYYGD